MKKEPYEYFFRAPKAIDHQMNLLVFTLLQRCFPDGISPHLFTVLSFLMNLCTLLIMGLFGCTLKTFPFVVLTTFVYLICDHTDGLCARYYNRESAIGELIDHTGDIIGVGTVLLFLYCFMGGRAILPLGTLLTLAYLQQTNIFAQEYETQWFNHKFFGFIEIFFGAAIIVAICLYSSLYLQLDQMYLCLYSLIESLILLVCPFAIVCIFFTNRKQPGIFLSLILNFISQALTVYFLLTAPIAVLFLALLLQNLISLPRVIYAHLLKEPFPLPELFTPILLGMMRFLGVYNAFVYLIALSYLSTKVIYTFWNKITTLHRLYKV